MINSLRLSISSANHNQELIEYRYSSCSCCWGDSVQKAWSSIVSIWIGGEIWQEYSCLREYASIDDVGFSIWRHAFKDGDHEVCRLPASPPNACDVIGSLSTLQFLVHSTFVRVCPFSRMSILITPVTHSSFTPGLKHIYFFRNPTTFGTLWAFLRFLLIGSILKLFFVNLLFCLMLLIRQHVCFLYAFSISSWFSLHTFWTTRLLPTCFRMSRLLSRCPRYASDWRPICFQSHFSKISWIITWPSWTLADLLKWT